jgi:hypothetical protein
MRASRARAASIVTAIGLAVGALTVVTPPALAANVPCDPGSLVLALAAISGVGKSGTLSLAPSCTYTMTAVNNTADGNDAFPDIMGDVTIIGNAATITRPSSGAPDFRFFIVDDGGSFNLSNVTLSNGSIPIEDVHGGAAILNRSQLTITGVTFLNNKSLASVGGGALDNHDMGQMTVTRSTFIGNVGLQGGAIEDEATLCHTSVQACGQATVTQSTFINNSTTQFGGGGFEGDDRRWGDRRLRDHDNQQQHALQQRNHRDERERRRRWRWCSEHGVHDHQTVDDLRQQIPLRRQRSQRQRHD